MKYFLIGTFVLLGLIVYRLYSPKPLTKDECYRLGSNERTALCLSEIEQREKDKRGPAEQFPLYQLEIIDAKMSGNSYYNNNPMYEATIKNNDAAPAGDVFMKFKFYPSNSKSSCADTPVDTSYIKATDLIIGGDAQRVKVMVPTNFDTSGYFSWCGEISSAKIFSY